MSNNKRLRIFIFLLFIFTWLLIVFTRRQTKNSLLYDLNRHLYTDSKSRPFVWLFHNQPVMKIPSVLLLSLATLKCHSSLTNRVHIELVRDIREWIDHVPSQYDFLSPVHQSDYFRAHILATYGGMYIDIDTIAFDTVDDWFDYLNEYTMVNADWSPNNDTVTMGVLGPWRSKHPLAVEWSRQQDVMLEKYSDDLTQHSLRPRQAQYPVAWAELGGELLLPLANDWLSSPINSVGHYRMNGAETSMQWTFDFKAPIRSLTTPHVETVIKRTKLLAFLHSQVARELDSLGIQQLLMMKVTVVELLATSMQMCQRRHEHCIDDQDVFPLTVKFGANESHVMNNRKLRKFMLNQYNSILSN